MCIKVNKRREESSSSGGAEHLPPQLHLSSSPWPSPFRSKSPHGHSASGMACADGAGAGHGLPDPTRYFVNHGMSDDPASPSAAEVMSAESGFVSHVFAERLDATRKEMLARFEAEAPLDQRDSSVYTGRAGYAYMYLRMAILGAEENIPPHNLSFPVSIFPAIQTLPTATSWPRPRSTWSPAWSAWAAGGSPSCAATPALLHSPPSSPARRARGRPARCTASDCASLPRRPPPTSRAIRTSCYTGGQGASGHCSSLGTSVHTRTLTTRSYRWRKLFH